MADMFLTRAPRKMKSERQKNGGKAKDKKNGGKAKDKKNGGKAKDKKHGEDDELCALTMTFVVFGFGCETWR